jgi:hypothetical protein
MVPKMIAPRTKVPKIRTIILLSASKEYIDTKDADSMPRLLLTACILSNLWQYTYAVHSAFSRLPGMREI